MTIGALRAAHLHSILDWMSWTTVYVQLPVEHTEQTHKCSWDTRITTYWCNTQRTGCGTRAHFSFRNVYSGIEHSTKYKRESSLISK